MILDLFDETVWAITPEKYETIRRVVELHAQGKGVSGLQPLNAEISDDGDMAVAGGINIRVIRVIGTIAPRMNLLTAYSGGVSAEKLRAALAEALDDSSVGGILLEVDSPGGTVDGTMEVAEFLLRNRDRKPVHAYTGGMMASAAYWISSATSRITALDTAKVGSIGVITTHIDRSKADEMAGIRRTYIYAGRWKALGADNKPLDKEEEERLQAMLQDIYEVFLDGVAEGRGVDVETVRTTMADGQIFIGAGAREVGLVDAIGTYDDAVEALAGAIIRRRRNEEAITLLRTAGRIRTNLTAARHLAGTL